MPTLNIEISVTAAELTADAIRRAGAKLRAPRRSVWIMHSAVAEKVLAGGIPIYAVWGSGGQVACIDGQYIPTVFIDR